jgi:hypothetical protein
MPTRKVIAAGLPILAFAIALVWAGIAVPAIGKVGFISAIIVVVGGPLLLYLRWEQAQRRRAERLMVEGGQAIGTVIDLRDTGGRSGDSPRVRLRLRIEPVDGMPAFEGETTITAPLLSLPYRGRRYPVWFDRSDQNDFVLGEGLKQGATPEVRRLFALAEGDDPGPHQSRRDPLDRLARLDELRRGGALSEDEFENLKAKILAAEFPS